MASNQEPNNNNFFPEPLLDKKNFRLTTYPLNPMYMEAWKMYKKHQDAYWRAEELDFSKDLQAFQELKEEERYFILKVLAFFASIDSIVRIGADDVLSKHILVPEVSYFYTLQSMVENIHSEVYSDMLMTLVPDEDERNKIFRSFENEPSIKKISEWFVKWITCMRNKQYDKNTPIDQVLADDDYEVDLNLLNNNLGKIIIALACIEGIFFSGAFVSIFWLKKYATKGLPLNGLVSSNQFISRDEGLHTDFGCLLYAQYIQNRMPQNEIHDMVHEMVNIACEFNKDALKYDLIGMNNKEMDSYTKWVADRLLFSIGYEKKYNAENPFVDIMESIQHMLKDNFFERRPNAYQSAFNENNQKTHDFERLSDY